MSTKPEKPTTACSSGSTISHWRRAHRASFACFLLPASPTNRSRVGGKCSSQSLSSWRSAWRSQFRSAIDFLDPRLRTPNQVEGLLGFPVTAWLMEEEDAGSAFEREQILRFANRIAQDRQVNQSRIFVFTSVKSRGGASTIVLRTAHALSSLGISALAVEANGYSTDPRYSKPQSRGLTAVLNGERPLHSEVILGDTELPDRIPTGEVAERTGLPGIKNLEDHLHRSIEGYDVVLVDTPPILVSADAEIIACLADVVVLVIEAESVTKEELRRAAKNLERLKVRAISALLNRVRRDEPSGLASVAVQEFLTGSGAPTRRLLSPWLWK